MNELELIVQYLDDTIIPIEISKNGDWIDLRAARNYSLAEGSFTLIDLGVAIKLPDGYEAHIAPRSSTFKNWGIIQTNGVGVVDNSYQGPNDYWRIPVYATRDTIINKGERICQFRIVKNQPPVILLHGKLTGTDRSGFGSTGIR